jgi:hypothetical protein
MTRATLAVAALIAFSAVAPAFAQSGRPPQLVLITEAEAKLPTPLALNLAMRAGVTRGPKVILVSPAAGDVPSPIHLQLKFESFGGAKIDLSSIKVMYLKNPTVDLTERLATVIQAGGIEVAAEAPAGVHHIRVDLKDSEGRAGTANFVLKVAQ